ncbi:MAG: hypothetical protein ACI85O_002669 [Saprospiraceae bacterium]|jgi:hypothetical protein
MKNLISLLLLFLSFSSTAQTIRATATAEVESGNLNFVIRNDGSLFHQNGETGKFIGATNAEGEKPALLDFAGLWIAGFQEGGFKASVATNRNIDTSHFAPGPTTLPYNLPLSIDKQEIFNQIWSVTAEDVLAHIADFALDQEIDTIRESVYQWPAYGNEHFQSLFDDTEDNDIIEERYLVNAPYFDWNGDGEYTPSLGDYPLLELLPDKVNGKRVNQMYYTVYNDHNNPNDKMKINVHQTAFTIECDEHSILNNTIFIDYEFTNQASNNIDSIRFGWFVDAALSCSKNNYAGTDTTTNSLYFYNGQDYDNSMQNEECENLPFPQNTPVVSLVNLSNNENECWTNTMSFNQSGFGSGAQTEPQSVVEYYRYLKGLWRDETPLNYGENGYGWTEPTAYIYPGNPATQEGWTMQNDYLHPDVLERYFLASTDNYGFYEYPAGFLQLGLAPLYSKQSRRKTIAFTFHQDDTENTLTNARSARDSLYRWYNLSGEEFPEYRISLGENCFRSHPPCLPPIEPIVSLYPNPVHDFITIRLSQKDMKYVKIYNVSGQLLLENEIEHSPFILDPSTFIINAEINISDFPAGFYAVHIEGVNGEGQVHKFLKM